MPTDHEKDLYRSGLAKTRGSLWGRIKSVFAGKLTISDSDIEDIEEILITSDVGMQYTTRIIEELGRRGPGSGEWTEESFKVALTKIVEEAVTYKFEDHISVSVAPSPEIILVVGVNGTGKTTTIGKLASRSVEAGKKVLLVAGDTFRAAASDQLEIWSKRSGSHFVRGPDGGDPAAVIHDAINVAVSTGIDRVFIDTAGRLHTKEPLMKELDKINRVSSKVLPGSPHEVLLVLDATTGQNALIQARTFNQSVKITGLVITKMDGSAKGGILIPIAGELGIPVKYVGLGEGVGDLVDFDPGEYARNLVG